DSYEKYLRLKVPDDKKGCLQDIHWSHGSFGYFPTYSLGSFFAAQFYTAIEKNITDTQGNMEKGDTTEILEWLRKNIHLHGRKYTSGELCKQVTGKTLDTGFFVDYLLQKYGL